MTNVTKDFVLQHEEIRKHFWCNVWIATASANDCKKSDVATRWADAALQDFDKRFPEPAENGNEH